MLAEACSIYESSDWPPTPSEDPVSLVQGATEWGPGDPGSDRNPEFQDACGRFTGRPLPGAHGPKVAHRWADGSSDPRRSSHGARGMRYM